MARRWHHFGHPPAWRDQRHPGGDDAGPWPSSRPGPRRPLPAQAAGAAAGQFASTSSGGRGSTSISAFSQSSRVALHAARLMDSAVASTGCRPRGRHLRLLPERDPHPLVYEALGYDDRAPRRCRRRRRAHRALRAPGAGTSSASAWISHACAATGQPRGPRLCVAALGAGGVACRRRAVGRAHAPSCPASSARARGPPARSRPSSKRPSA